MELYLTEASPPCRSVWMLTKELQLPVTLKHVDTRNNEQKQAAYLEMNPTHCVPTLRDGDFVLWESRAIMRYLASKSGETSVYPSDPQKRAAVERLLDYDIGSLMKSVGAWIGPQLFQYQDPSEEQTRAMEFQLARLNDVYLRDGCDFLVGDQLTIADLSIAAGIVSLEVVEYDCSQYERIAAWLGRIKKLPYFDECHSQMYTWAKTRASGGEKRK